MPVSALGCMCTETAQRVALLQVSAEVVSEGADADLIILEGMGRGIETNLHAQFTVDALKLGMIKHREVCPTPIACLLQLHFMAYTFGSYIGLYIGHWKQLRCTVHLW